MTLQGQMLMWCASCRVFFPTSEASFDWTCPRCRQAVRTLRCYRCGHEWTPRAQSLPRCCAGKTCKSPYWNRARMVARGEKG